MWQPKTRIAEVVSLKTVAIDLAETADRIRAIETRCRITSEDGKGQTIDLGEEGIGLAKSFDFDVARHRKESIERGCRDAKTIQDAGPGADNYMRQTERLLEQAAGHLAKWKALEVADALELIEVTRVEYVGRVVAATAHEAAYKLVCWYQRRFREQVTIPIQANHADSPGYRYRFFRDFLVEIREEPPWSKDELITKIKVEAAVAGRMLYKRENNKGKRANRPLPVAAVAIKSIIDDVYASERRRIGAEEIASRLRSMKIPGKHTGSSVRTYITRHLCEYQTEDENGYEPPNATTATVAHS